MQPSGQLTDRQRLHIRSSERRDSQIRSCEDWRKFLALAVQGSDKLDQKTDLYFYAAIAMLKDWELERDADTRTRQSGTLAALTDGALAGTGRRRRPAKGGD